MGTGAIAGLYCTVGYALIVSPRPQCQSSFCLGLWGWWSLCGRRGISLRKSSLQEMYQASLYHHQCDRRPSLVFDFFGPALSLFLCEILPFALFLLAISCFSMFIAFASFIYQWLTFSLRITCNRIKKICASNKTFFNIILREVFMPFIRLISVV